jgi:hypothetical protein
MYPRYQKKTHNQPSTDKKRRKMGTIFNTDSSKNNSVIKYMSIFKFNKLKMYLSLTNDYNSINNLDTYLDMFDLIYEFQSRLLSS